jgi:ABC-type polysaccharide transport system permease subunit
MKNTIICVINIIILLSIIKISNITTNKFEKKLLLLKNNNKFDLKGIMIIFFLNDYLF